MRGERSGRKSDSLAKAAQAGMAPATEGPPTWQALGDLVRLVARSNAPQLRLRLIGAIAMTLAGKALGVLAPLVLGAAVNHLAADQPTGVAIGLGFAGFAVGWAVVRLLSAIAPNASDVVFAPVRSAAQRTAATETFAHALNLSLDFHQTKRSGSLSRTMDRGARSVDFLLRILAFNLVPTGVELVLAAGVLAGKYDWRFGAVAVVVVAVYAASTFALSNWRLEHRREMNAADTEAAGVSVDALLNYETVKSFGAEARAARTYDAALGDYTRASLKANSSLALLNVMQAVIMNVGLGVMAVMAGFEAAAGRMGPGDVTAAVLILISLYAPLNILGFAYREIRQSFIDMEEMLKVTRQTPQVADAAELDDFIRGLPEGMDTRVGERGLKLSGGERQRVGIARALLADPCILILDEATSALDSRTEAAIQKTLRKARSGRTTLVVAHRLSTIADAEQILVLKAGRVIERGAHHELVARQGGEYAALWRKQTRGARTGVVAD